MRHLNDKFIRFKSAVAKLSEQKAKVIYTGDLIDKSSRTTSLIAEAPNPDRQLKLGMFVEVGFESGEEEKALLIPSSALLYIDNNPVVFVQTKEDEFQKRQITLGKTGDAGIAVVGLKAGERVVIKGGFVLKSELLKEQMVGE